MIENKNISKTPISELGEFGLIDFLTNSIEVTQESTILSIGDDAAVISQNEN